MSFTRTVIFVCALLESIRESGAHTELHLILKLVAREDLQMDVPGLNRLTPFRGDSETAGLGYWHGQNSD